MSYKSFRLKVKEIIEAEKTSIGLKAVYSPLPPFVPIDKYPLVAIQINRQFAEGPAITGGVFRPELIVNVWIQIMEIERNSIEKLRENPDICSRIQDDIDDITWKTAEVLRKNRSLLSEAVETNIRGIDMIWKPSLYVAGAIVAGSVIEFGGKMKDFEVDMV